MLGPKISQQADPHSNLAGKNLSKPMNFNPQNNESVPSEDLSELNSEIIQSNKKGGRKV
jgi:hypothetical protein